MRYLMSIAFAIIMLSFNSVYAKGQVTEPTFVVCQMSVQGGYWHYKHEWMRPLPDATKTITTDQCAMYCF